VSDHSHAFGPSRPARGWRFRVAALALIAVSLTVPTGFWMARCISDNPSPPNPSSPTPPAVPSVGGVPLFATWPADKTPDAAIVLTGQTWGYMRPCGCSANQKGGLERRANLIAMLKAKGWPVAAVDLGDVAAPKSGVHDQNMLKYKYTMEAMREMGYAAVGVGEYDFNQQLYELLGQYTYQTQGERPAVVCANLVGVDEKMNVIPREMKFPPAKEGKKSAVEAVEVVTVGAVPVGITSVVGKDMYDKLKKIDPNFGFLENATVKDPSGKEQPGALQAALNELATHPKKPSIKVLLYQGSKDDATKVAGTFPEFNVILCLSQAAESEPPQFPTVLNGGKTLLIQVGHKGMSVGVVGVFKSEAGFDLKYQLVPLTEEFKTPDDQVKDDKVIASLERYAADVRKQNLLAQFVARPQPNAAQIQHPEANLKFVGSESCAKCHAAEFKVWQGTKHSNAMSALEKKADRPKNRQFDGECVVCHTVGFAQISGYQNDKDTPLLRNVGCESCHGPGSGHAANPNNKALFAALSPWKSKPTDKLPPAAVLNALAAAKPGQPAAANVTASQQLVMTAVSTTCMRCHDQENDPHFDMNKFMPQVWHSGLKGGGTAGLPPNVK
jgi:2',3'-cyclic-nucleotide 2'-phosphodiesterase (5'-nucleotidase family)